VNAHSPSTDSRGSSGLSLAVRLREGSADAWRDLVDLYGPLVHQWCCRKGLNDGEAADVAQDVFLAVHRAIAAFDPTAPRATFRGWLWTITLNKIRERARRDVGPAAVGGSTALGRMAGLPDPAVGAEEEPEPSDAGATAQLVRRALEQIRPTLAPPTWEAFWRTTVLGHPAPQVAEELGLTSAAVRQAKSRVLRRLRRQLGDHQ
jgi:RNA polymerase sigma-70 factor (ECF subfamily)